MRCYVDFVEEKKECLCIPMTTAFSSRHIATLCPRMLTL